MSASVPKDMRSISVASCGRGAFVLAEATDGSLRPLSRTAGPATERKSLGGDELGLW